nr:immunoglobulin light chain junction region [Macaca mulatta]
CQQNSDWPQCSV